MALTLTGILKIKERERLARDGSLRGAAQMYAASLREKEEQKKKDEYQRQQQLIQDKYMEGIRARERQALEDERNTKRYFQVDKYGRKIPAPDEPVFFGQMIEKSQAWLPHGPGQFSINGEVVMKGEFKNGDFTQGTVHWGDGSVWEGGLVDHKMNGVGFVTDPLGERKEAMMRRSVLVCYKDELHNGKQIEFGEQVFDVYPPLNRKPTATIIRNIRGWLFECKFHSDVWPQDRQIDLAVTSNFNLLRLRPIIYPLQGFGIPVDAERVYDHRYVCKLNRSRLRDTASNVLLQQSSTADIFKEEEKDDVSVLDAEDELSVASTASKLRSKLGNLRQSMSLMDNGVSGKVSVSEAYSKALVRRDSDSTAMSSAPKLAGDRPVVSRLNGPNLQRLIPQFPRRDKRDRSSNYFESRAVGIGAAKEEDEMAIQEELKKRQWAALIEERRAKQSADKQREIEEQQRNFMEQSLAEKREADASKKEELERFKRETEEAVANELRVLSRE